MTKAELSLGPCGQSQSTDIFRQELFNTTDNLKTKRILYRPAIKSRTLLTNEVNNATTQLYYLQETGYEAHFRYDASVLHCDPRGFLDGLTEHWARHAQHSPRGTARHVVGRKKCLQHIGHDTYEGNNKHGYELIFKNTHIKIIIDVVVLI